LPFKNERACRMVHKYLKRYFFSCFVI